MEQTESLALTAEEQRQIETSEAEETTTEGMGTVTPPPDTTATETEPSIKESPQQKLVPLAALHEARMETKEIRKKLEEQGEKFKSLESLKEELLVLRQEREKAKEPKIPTFEEDPLGHLAAKQELLDKKTQAQEQEYSKEKEIRAKQEKEYREQQELLNTVASHETEFLKTNKDYNEAINYIKDFRRRELEIMGITDPITVNREIALNAMNFSRIALQQGKNPAELIYNLSKQYGYKPKEKVETTLETVEKGQKAASKTLSQGGKTEGNLTAERLLALGDEEFLQEWEKLFKSA